MFFIGLVLCVGLGTVPAAREQAAPVPDQPQVIYETFVELETEPQRELFARLSPTDKSSLKREHARRWLASNRAHLSGRQTAAVERAIAFISPALYATVPIATNRETEDAFRRELECTIGPPRRVQRVYLLSTRAEARRSRRGGGRLALLVWQLPHVATR
jgi:hypothetical protein